jgi:hypothetical protein
MTDRFVWGDDEPELVDSAAPRFEIRSSYGLVEAWSTFRLPYQPKDDALKFRNKLAKTISEMAHEPDHILDCTYCSTDSTFADTENVLIYNVGGKCFSEAAARGIRFERVHVTPPSPPTQLPEPGAQHYVAYRTVSPDHAFTHWQRGRVVASWSDATWPATKGTAPASYWLAIRTSTPDLSESLDQGAHFGLRVVVTGSGKPIEPAKIIKPLYDGAISAFHVHNEPVSMRAAVERLAANGRGEVVDLERLLRDPRFDLLGKRNLVSPYRGGIKSDGVKWNPEDERCVAGELLWTPGTGEKRFSGELFELQPR